jgi:sterol desaturase/sphingolipid hydroxylase (fatty acid hydroxylase superfamily)
MAQIGKTRRLVCWLGILAAVALVLLTSSSLLQSLVASHQRAPYFFVLWILFGIGATFTAMLAAFLIELLLIGWVGSSLEALWKARASMKLDVLATLVMQLPHKYFDYVLSLGLLYIIGTRLPHPTGISVTHWLPSWGLQAGCALLFASLVNYWVHRLQHAIPALWALHKFHHSADRLAILTTFRGTKLESALSSALRIFPIAILSVPIAVKPTAASPWYFLAASYFLFVALSRLNSFLIHSNLDLGYGWVGRWLIVSPRMHRIHHSSSTLHHTRNFSFDLVLWDRIFGTYFHCDNAAQIPVGLADNPFNSSESLKGVLRDYFLTTYAEFWRAVREGHKAWLPVRAANEAVTSRAARQL